MDLFRRVFVIVSLAGSLMAGPGAYCADPPAEVTDEDLLVLNGWAMWEDERPTLQRYLHKRAFELLDQREKEIRSVRGRSGWMGRIARARARFREVVGAMPERTPLNARVTGTDEMESFRIEKIVFESRPEMYVTGCMLIPKDIDEPRPAVLYVCGHSATGYRFAGYQQVIFNLAKKGFVVLAMDPVGQGERLMYLDDTQTKSRFGATGEHSYCGKQTLLAGVSLGNYFVWDMVRALDYLETREEVDPERLAVQGRSGGGTQSSYLMAYDDRVALAGPECYITGVRRLIQSIGTQDAEQNWFRGLAVGLDHADFLEIRAPKPTIVVATTNDFFSITGVRETVAEARRAFSSMGAEENLVLVEDDAIHASTKKNREAFYTFLREHFDLPGPIEDEVFEVMPDERLNSTETGQVLTSLGGKSVFEYNQDYALELQKRLDEDRADPFAHRKAVRMQAGRLSGYEKPLGSAGEPMFMGRLPMDGYAIEKWVIADERGLVIPALLGVPADVEHGTEPRAATLILAATTKVAARALIGELAREGTPVLAVDLAGMGETASGNREYQDPYLALWMGISVVGVRAGQISRCVDFLSGMPYVDRENITAVAYGGTGSTLLHAAVFEDHIKRIALLDGLAAYKYIVMNREYEFDSSELIGGVLEAYDLPDIVALLAPRDVFIAGARDHNGEVVEKAEREKELSFARKCYRQESAANHLVSIQSGDEAERDAAFQSWLRQ